MIAAPRSVSVLNMITGRRGRRRRISVRASRPSISGISTSRITTSGLSCSILASADLAVRRDPHHLDLGLGAERLGDEAADDDGVVDDEDADLAHCSALREPDQVELLGETVRP